MGVSMPSRYSSEHSKDDAQALAERLGTASARLRLRQGRAEPVSWELPENFAATPEEAAGIIIHMCDMPDHLNFYEALMVQNKLPFLDVKNVTSVPVAVSVFPDEADFAPRSWAFCDGQLLPIAEHERLVRRARVVVVIPARREVGAQGVDGGGANADPV